MKNFLPLICALFISAFCFAQEQNPYPLGQYDELTDTKSFDDASIWEKMKSATALSWGSIDVRYKKKDMPTIAQQNLWRAKAWKGERVNAQAVLWTKSELKDVTVSVSDLKCGSTIIPSSDINTSFVRYVMTDEYNKGSGSGCGARPNKAEWDSSLVADVLDVNTLLDVKKYNAQPIWVNVWVPAEAKAGKYRGTLTVSAANLSPMTLQMEVEVINRTLPAPSEWQYHVDLWQNPYSVARYHQVPLWSQEHFDAMLPLMKMLANIGQKVITTSIMHKPWAGQTEDHFDSMVTRIKKLDGTWQYDYAVFDKWVEFMLNEVGITNQINCYTMIPWALTFDYYDEATNRVQFLNAKPGEQAYTDYWLPFLVDFSKHLRAKGWFDITTIAMDERPMKSMMEAIKIIKQADPEYKISLAGHYHDELQGDLYDLCLAYGHKFPEDVLKQRKADGKISTVYTCCTEAFPNMFTFSAPAESTWTMLHAIAEGYDGYLRWAVNSWTADPLLDSRFRTWAAGDCYSIYPGARSSIRFERMVEGVQESEKVRILREEYAAKGQKAKLDRLNRCVSKFTLDYSAKNIGKIEDDIKELNRLLNN